MTTISRSVTAKTKVRTTAPGRPLSYGPGDFFEEHLGGEGRAATGQGRGPKSSALSSMLAAGKNDEEDAIGWDDRYDYFEVGDGKHETEDNGTGAAGLQIFLLLCQLLCCVVLDMNNAQ